HGWPTPLEWARTESSCGRWTTRTWNRYGGKRMNDRLKIEVPNQSLGGACPSFFLHTTVVLGWMGQFPSAASQAIYMRKQVGLRFPSDKTLRTLEHRRRLTRKTEEK